MCSRCDRAGCSDARSNSTTRLMAVAQACLRSCSMEGISDTGAKLMVEGALDGLHLKEFFLLLSSTGLAYRRCEPVWVHGCDCSHTRLVNHEG